PARTTASRPDPGRGRPRTKSDKPPHIWPGSARGPTTAHRINLAHKPTWVPSPPVRSCRTPVSHEAEWIRQTYNDAMAIEMEGAGVAQAGHLSGSPVAIVRGISDRADGTKATEA